MNDFEKKRIEKIRANSKTLSDIISYFLKDKPRLYAPIFLKNGNILLDFHSYGLRYNLRTVITLIPTPEALRSRYYREEQEFEKTINPLNDYQILTCATVELFNKWETSEPLKSYKWQIKDIEKHANFMISVTTDFTTKPETLIVTRLKD